MARKHIIKMLPWYVMALALCVLLARGASEAATVLVENSPLPGGRTCIVIDAGHGGIDGGAESVTGVPESQINLEIALRLKDMMNLLGYKANMLRTTDTSLHTEGATIGAQKISDLKQRVRMVNEYDTSVLISIHQNTFSDKRYSGAQVFYSAHDDSRNLAQLMQQNLIQTLNKQSNRKPKAAKGIYLMEKISCPGVLVECGFLTNPQEEALLRSDDYQKKLCSVIAATVTQWQEATP